MKRMLILLIFFFSLFILASNAEARSGCCSYHQGVRSDGCGCNDGTPLSSTCAPYYACTSNYSEPTYVPISVAPTVIYYTPTRKPTLTPTNTPTPTITPTPIITPAIKLAPQQITNANSTPKKNLIQKILEFIFKLF